MIIESTWFDDLHNAIVATVALPNQIKECVTENADGTYTIFLSSALDQEARLAGYLHALKHILNNDFEKTDVQEIEAKAH